jgi:Fucose permease
MPKPSRPLIFLLHFAYLLTGIATVLIGQVLPFLSRRLSLTDADAGQFFIAQFSGSISGVLIFDFLVRRFGFISATLLGMTCIGLGCQLLNSGSTAVCAAGFFINGIGVGTTLPSINMLVAEFYPLRTASALNILNFFWGVGAIVSQPFVSILSRETNVFTPTAILSVLSILSALSLFLLAPKREKNPAAEVSNRNESSPQIWKSPVAWLIAVFHFLHVGLESGVGGWPTTYSARLSFEESLTFSATPVFYIFFVLGRGTAPSFLRFLNENIFILLSLLVVTCGIFLVIFADSYELMLFGAGVLGFGTSGIFPTNMARFTKYFRRGRNQTCDADLRFRKSRRRVHDLADRLRFELFLKSARGNFRSSRFELNARFPADYFAKTPASKF